MKHTEFIENIRSIKRMIETDIRGTNINDGYRDKLEWWSEAFISVIQEIDRKSEELPPTILEKAILDFIDSRENKKTTMSDIINACAPGEKYSEIVIFIEEIVLQLQSDHKIIKLHYITDKYNTYEAFPDPVIVGSKNTAGDKQSS